MERESRIASLRELIGTLMEEMKMPKTFDDLGVKLKVRDIDSHFCRAFSDPKMLNHLPLVTKENIYPILESKC